MTPIETVFLILSILILLCLIILIVLLVQSRNKKGLSFDESLNKAQEANKAIFENYSNEVETLIRTTFTNIISSQATSFSQMSTPIHQSLKEIQSEVSSEKEKTSNYLGDIKDTLSKSILALQAENSAKLDQMRELVDKKMQETLNMRITSSFKEVRDGIDSVLGVVKQMESVSNDVTSLSKVLANVKTKGIMGEVELGNILSDILTKDQYSINVKTKKDSSDYVEYAIKMPGKDNRPVYLPIDSKFPLEVYKNLLAAYDENDQIKIEFAKKELANRIKSEAKDIKEKYIDVPFTTDFGVLFLPSEGLYAEVMNLDSTYQIQREFKIMIAGPSTMAALINSLQLGFKTLAIEANSRQIGIVLLKVKKEFMAYQSEVEEVNKRLAQASKSMDSLVGTRTRVIIKELSSVESLDQKEIEKSDEGQNRED